MALREIRLVNDRILRKKSAFVKVVDDKIRQILNDMAETMYKTEYGAGLASSTNRYIETISCNRYGTRTYKTN